MTLPTNLVSLSSSSEANRQYHQIIDQLITDLALPASISPGAGGHLAHHAAVHGWIHSDLPLVVADSDPGHALRHNRIHDWANYRLTPRGPQPGVTQPGGATVVNPGDDINTKMVAAGAAGTLWFAAGTHRVAGHVTNGVPAGQLWLGAYGAILDGSVVISGPWTVSGSQSWAAAQLPASASTTGVCESGGDDCKPAEDVYLDGVKLTRVMTQAAATAGKFYADYAANRIYLATADSPSTKTVEQAKADCLIHPNQATQAGVTIRNLTFRKFATVYQRGIICAGNGSGTGWTIDQCEFFYSHADGVRSFGSDFTVRNCIIRDNGSVGCSIYNLARPTGENCDVYGNDNNGFALGWESGGFKWVKVDDAVVRGCDFHDNLATGLWFDIDSRRGHVYYNRFLANSHHGIHYEISFDGDIHDNVIVGNTNAGIQWNASGRGTVAWNYLDGNEDDLVFIEDPNRNTTDPSIYEPHELLGITVTDNRVRHPASTAGEYALRINLYNGGTAPHLAEVAADRNHYLLPDLTGTWFFRNANTTWAGWQAAAEDLNGTAELA